MAKVPLLIKFEGADLKRIDLEVEAVCVIEGRDVPRTDVIRGLIKESLDRRCERRGDVVPSVELVSTQELEQEEDPEEGPEPDLNGVSAGEKVETAVKVAGEEVVAEGGYNFGRSEENCKLAAPAGVNVGECEETLCVDDRSCGGCEGITPSEDLRSCGASFEEIQVAEVGTGGGRGWLGNSIRTIGVML